MPTPTNPVQFAGGSRIIQTFRAEIPNCLSQIQSLSDTGNLIDTTSADQEICVYGYAFSTVATSGGIITIQSAGTSALLWTINLVAPSGTIAGANLAVTPPAYLFKAPKGESITAVFSAPFSDPVEISMAYFVQAYL